MNGSGGIRHGDAHAAGNKTMVVIKLSGGSSVEQPAHFHTGPATSTNPARSTGSTTWSRARRRRTVNVPIDKLTAGNLIINVHKSYDESRRRRVVRSRQAVNLLCRQRVAVQIGAGFLVGSAPAGRRRGHRRQPRRGDAGALQRGGRARPASVRSRARARHLLDQQSAVRGYVATGDKSFFASLRAADAALRADLATLDTATRPTRSIPRGWSRSMSRPSASRATSKRYVRISPGS